jgi:DNA-3-methyladenine glycosylase II
VSGVRTARLRNGGRGIKQAAAPRFIKTDADLAANLDELVSARPEFARIREAAGTITLRWLDEGFSGLVWVITGQQISVAAGRAIYNRCQDALGAITPETLSGVEDAALKAAGYSAPKIRTLRAVTEAALAGQLDFGVLHNAGAADAIAHLTAIKGIGPWTAEVYLMFAVGHPDILPGKDVALQEAARLAFKLEERPAEKALIAMGEPWRPHRSAAARLLWAYYRVAKGGRDAAPLPAG